MLARKTYITGSGRDPPWIVWIHLTVGSKFGVDLLFGSGVIVGDYLVLHGQVLVSLDMSVVSRILSPSMAMFG